MREPSDPTGAAAEPTRRRVTLALAALATGPVPAVRALAQPAVEPGPPLPAVGAPYPLNSVALLDGGTFEPTDADGKVLVLYWWASWCPFCALQSPAIEALWREQRSRGLLVLGLSVDATPEPAKAYRDRRGLTFPSGWVGAKAGHALAKPRGGMPVTLVRGRDGRLLMSEAGQLFAEDVAAIARFL